MLSSLALGGTAIAGGLGTRESAATSKPILRVGYVAPVWTGQTPVPTDASIVAGDMGRLGAQMAADAIDPSAEQLQLLLSSAPDVQTTVEEARRLIALEKVSAIIGGFGEDSARALADLAEKSRVVFCNVGASSDLLRNSGCVPYAFHIEASAAQYLDALAGWFAGRPAFSPPGASFAVVRHPPARTIFFVARDSPEGRARYERALRALTRQRWQGRDLGHVFVSHGQPDFHALIRTIRQRRPELVFLLLDAASQLDFIDQGESDGLVGEICGFPEPATQTPSFLTAALGASPRLGTGVRAVLWDHALRGVEAAELNNRFREQWGRPMEGASWASWAAVQTLWKATVRAGTPDPARMVRQLESPRLSFNGHKGVPLTFRPWDHQLRQPVYLVRANAKAQDIPWDLTDLIGIVPHLKSVEQTPEQALDLLGDAKDASGCRFASP